MRCDSVRSTSALAYGMLAIFGSPADAAEKARNHACACSRRSDGAPRSRQFLVLFRLLMSFLMSTFEQFGGLPT